MPFAVIEPSTNVPTMHTFMTVEIIFEKYAETGTCFCKINI